MLDELPEVSGELIGDADLSKIVHFGVGGKADVLFIPSDADDLSFLLRSKANDVPITVIGSGSNLLIRDGGISGIVIKLSKWFESIYIEGDIVEAGAGCLLSKLANKAMDTGISGFEFFSGIPGTIGGALKMNAGCYGSCFKDIFIEAEAVDSNGNAVWLTKDNIDFIYRSSSIPDNVIVTRVWMRGKKSDSSTVSKVSHEILSKRIKSQPLSQRSCGSTFKNPENCAIKSWQLIDKAGCRGMKIGGAMVSDVHCNFIVNAQNATAKDIESLGNEVIKKVKESSGVTLEWEVIILGRHN